jgi:hypothetical protein
VLAVVSVVVVGLFVVVSVVVVGLFVVVVSSVVVVLVCANANGATRPQTKAIIIFFTLPSFLIGLPPQFVTHGSSGRPLRVNSSPVWSCGDSNYLRFPRFEWASRVANMRQK